MHIPKLSLFICLLFFQELTFSQELEILREVSIGEPVTVSLNRKGAFLYADKSGKLNSISEDGKVELNYAPQRNSSVSLVEAWTTLDILVFYESLQKITLLNRFLTPISEVDLTPHVGFARLATYNFESNIWIIDDIDFTLKLLDVNLDEVVIQTPLNGVLDQGKIYNFTYMREYQNLLFLSDLNSGILIFDNLGNYLRTLAVPGISFFSFLGNEIYYKAGSHLVFKDIYTSQERKITPPEGDFYLAFGDKLYIVSGNTLRICQY